MSIESHTPTGDGEELHFTRGIVPSSASEASYQSQYKIDNRTVTWDAYIAKLKSFGILVKARNFLVFQVRRRVDQGAFRATMLPFVLQARRQAMPMHINQ